jgi:hypothetical protein
VNYLFKLKVQIDIGTLEKENHLKPMIQSSIASDITLIVDGEAIPAHKIILTRSKNISFFKKSQLLCHHAFHGND